MRIHAFRRTAPIEVDLNTRLIRFYLLENKAVVADVDEAEYADRLLAIPEAYREYVEAPIAANAGTPTDAQRQAAADEALRQKQLQEANAVASGIAATDIVKAATSSTVLIGSDLQPAVIDLTGSKSITLGEVVAHAFQAAKDEEGNALDIAGWNALEQADREARIAEAVSELETRAEQDEEAEAQRLRDQIAADAKKAKDERDAAAADAGADAREPTAEELAQQAAALKYTLKNGSTVIDLKTMSDPELRTFAKSYRVVLPTGLRGDQIRQHIVDALAPEEK